MVAFYPFALHYVIYTIAIAAIIAISYPSYQVNAIELKNDAMSLLTSCPLVEYKERKYAYLHGNRTLGDRLLTVRNETELRKLFYLSTSPDDTFIFHYLCQCEHSLRSIRVIELLSHIFPTLNFILVNGDVIPRLQPNSFSIRKYPTLSYLRRGSGTPLLSIEGGDTLSNITKMISFVIQAGHIPHRDISLFSQSKLAQSAQLNNSMNNIGNHNSSSAINSSTTAAVAPKNKVTFTTVIAFIASFITLNVHNPQFPPAAFIELPLKLLIEEQRLPMDTRFHPSVVVNLRNLKNDKGIIEANDVNQLFSDFIQSSYKNYDDMPGCNMLDNRVNVMIKLMGSIASALYIFIKYFKKMMQKRV